MQLLGISLVAMAVLSVVIFELAIKGGVRIEMEGGHVRTLKGEEYETFLTIRSSGTDWIGSIPTTFKIETGQLVKIEQVSEGKMRLLFLGRYAGRTEGVSVGISLTDPLRLMRKLDEVRHTDFVLDTLPLSLLARAAPRKVTVFGFGEQPTGYPGPGQELYGLDEYQSTMDTKDIIWKRVAKSPDERLIARLREASVRDVVRVGVIQYSERTGEARSVWIDSLCEALGQAGREVFEIGSSITLQYNSPRRYGSDDGEGERVTGMTQMRASDPTDLAEAVMSVSVASSSRAIESVVAESDFIVTGLKELEDEKMAAVIAEKPLLLISEPTASPSAAFTERSVIWTGHENLFPLIRRMLER
jgi:hypothetical protein